MKRITALLCFALFSLTSLFAAGKLTINPPISTVNDKIVLNYVVDGATEKWMTIEDAYIYICLELDGNGEWAKEKKQWDETNIPQLKWSKGKRGNLTYTINNLKSFFKLTDDELLRVSGIFVIIKNDKNQTTDMYMPINDEAVSKADFKGRVKFRVTAPAGTEKVYVAGTFGKEGSELWWSHANPALELKKLDATHFEATITNVPADLKYLYVYGSGKDQSELRFNHRPLGARTYVNDKIDSWGKMTITLTAPANTSQLYISGNFTGNKIEKMMNDGNDTWSFEIDPTSFKGEKITYKYYYSVGDGMIESKVVKSNVLFEGFSTQFDEIKKW